MIVTAYKIARMILNCGRRKKDSVLAEFLRESPIGLATLVPLVSVRFWRGRRLRRNQHVRLLRYHVVLIKSALVWLVHHCGLLVRLG